MGSRSSFWEFKVIVLVSQYQSREVKPQFSGLVFPISRSVISSIKTEILKSVFGNL